MAAYVPWRGSADAMHMAMELCILNHGMVVGVGADTVIIRHCCTPRRFGR